MGRMDRRLIFHLARLPTGLWLRLEHAMQVALWGEVPPEEVDIYEAISLPGSLLAERASGDADGFNATVVELQQKLQAVAADGRLPMRGLPKRFWEDEPKENNGRSADIPSWWFTIDAVRGFNFNDGSIDPFSFENGDLDRYDSIVRPTGEQPDSPDEWRFVVLERAAFIAFLRNDMGAALVEGSGPECRVELPRIDDSALIQLLRRHNERMGGSDDYPISRSEAREDAPKLISANFQIVTHRGVDEAHKRAFPNGKRGRRPKEVSDAIRNSREKFAQEI